MWTLLALFLSTPTPAAPAAPLPTGALLRLTSETIVNAATPDTFTVENLGEGPVTLKVKGGTDLTATPATLVVPPHGKAEIDLLYEGPCEDGGSGMYSCGSTSLGLTGKGGTMQVEVVVHPPAMGVIGSVASWVYWDPTGAPPSGRDRGLGGLGEPPAPCKEPCAPELYGERREVASPRGPFSLQIYATRNLEQQGLKDLEDALAAAVLACDPPGAPPIPAWLLQFGMEGHVYFDRSGLVSSVAQTDHLEHTLDQCVTEKLVGTRIHAVGEGSAGFSVRPPRPPKR